MLELLALELLVFENKVLSVKAIGSRSRSVVFLTLKLGFAI
jgi:hypothetical protein